MHPVLVTIREAIRGTPFEGDLFLVGGAVRDGILHPERPLGDDLDLVTRGSSAELARLLWDKGLSSIPPVTYERFGTAMVRIDGIAVELVTARKESYDAGSRKPNVVAATYLEDALRRDFTVNALLQPLDGGPIFDPLGTGLSDLAAGILRTPLDPAETFRDDPLRMLRAIRFRWKLGFQPTPELYPAIVAMRDRLQIVSFERIRDEVIKILLGRDPDEALRELMELGFFGHLGPEFESMVGCLQGDYHHLDVWDHTRLVAKNMARLTADMDPEARKFGMLAALFHDVGKPPTRMIDKNGNIRFFTHEIVGAEMTRAILRRWKMSESSVSVVALLVKSHHRLFTSETFSTAAARRVVRDLGEWTELLLTLVAADIASLKPGIEVGDLRPIRAKIAEVGIATPPRAFQSPLDGQAIMALTGLPAGPEVGRLKGLLEERVIEGEFGSEDSDAARAWLIAYLAGK